MPPKDKKQQQRAPTAKEIAIAKRTLRLAREQMLLSTDGYSTEEDDNDMDTKSKAPIEFNHSQYGSAGSGSVTINGYSPEASKRLLNTIQMHLKPNAAVTINASVAGSAGKGATNINGVAL